jgi:hypothetical protein
MQLPLTFGIVQCESYLRLAKESLAQTEQDIATDDIDAILQSEDEDKTFVAMGMAKTIGTVGLHPPLAIKRVSHVLRKDCLFHRQFA